MLCDYAGERVVPVVSECKCVGGCYRLPHFQEVTVYGDNGTQELGTGEEREGEEREGQEGKGEGGRGGVIGEGEKKAYQRMVDIGKCTGKCSPPEQKCIP